MASVNKVILVGNLGADPETRYLPSGDAVSNIRLATTDRYKEKGSGEMKELTEWHRVAFFGRLAEIAGEYLKKGSSAPVNGPTKPASKSIRPKSLPTRCKCWAAAVARWAQAAVTTAATSNVNRPLSVRHGLQAVPDVLRLRLPVRALRRRVVGLTRWMTIFRFKSD